MKNARERPQKGGFAQSRHAFQQHVAAGKEANQYAVDDVLLPDDDFADLAADKIQPRNGFRKRRRVSHMNIVWQAGTQPFPPGPGPATNVTPADGSGMMCVTSLREGI